MIDPVGYLGMLYAVKGAAIVLTGRTRSAR